MRIYDLLTHRERTALFKLSDGIKHHSDNRTLNRRISERLTERDVKKLMSTNRQIHKRVNGRVKRK